MSQETIIKNNQSEDFIRIQDLGYLFLSKWYWFIGSVVVALTIAALYIAVTPPIYTRTAALLVKDTSKGGSSSANAMNEFADLGIFQSNTNINNELLALKSPTLMKEVVARLNLNTSYTIQTGLRTKELYKASPVWVTVLNAADTPLEFDIEMLADNQFKLSGFKTNGEESKESLQGVYGDSIQTPAGTLILTPTPAYSKESEGNSVYFSQASIEQVSDHYNKGLRAELSDEKSTVISLSINDVSPKRAEDLLSMLIKVYNESWIQDKNQIAVSTSQFISDRLDVIEGELGNVDENISNYKSRNLLPDVQAASSMYMAQSTENKKRLMDLNNQLSMAQYIRRHMSNNESKSVLLPSNSGIANANIESQISEYNTLLLQRNNLQANSSEKNPLVVDMTQSLNAMWVAITRSIDNLVLTLNTQIKNTQSVEIETTQQIASNPKQAKYLLSVERQQKVKEELYLYLLQKREENELSQAFTAYNTRVITPARGSDFPTAPRRSNIFLVALAIGLLLPAVIIFLIENMNVTVRGKKDLDVLTIPYVGEIPLVGKKKKFIPGKTDPEEATKGLAPVITSNNHDYVNEAFRVIRTNIDFMLDHNTSNHVIMLTSFNPGSGKTFITMNLAVSMALKGQKVAMIDLDMRKASLSRYIDRPSTGASSYLGGLTNSIQDIMVKGTIHPNLDIIPVGVIPPNPAELLLNDRFPELLEKLRKEYDYIFIDCPPTDIVADSSIIGRYVDMTLFIIRAGLLDRQMLPEAERMYQNKKYKNMSVILNGTVYEQGRYGYRRYGYSYGYHSYGYYGNSKN